MPGTAAVELDCQPSHHETSRIEVRSVTDLIHISHQMAIEKGWWKKNPDGSLVPRSWIEQVNNFFSEISEAWEEYRAGRVDTWYGENGKPEGFFVEVADLLIRLGDTLGSRLTTDLAVPGNFPHPTCRVDLVDELFMLVGQIREGHVESASALIFVMVFWYCQNVETTSMWELITQKVQYNSTRGHRHGNKLA